MPGMFSLGRLSQPQRVLFVAWLSAIALRAWGDLIKNKDWPCPATYVKITGVYLILSLFSELGDDQADLAAWTGVGLLVAFIFNEGRNVGGSGYFFGYKVAR
jgi:hypothetical protein